MLILKSFYDRVYLCKPLQSHASNSEKYLVCMGFKDSKQIPAQINQLDSLLDRMTRSTDEPLDIFTEYQFDPAFLNIWIKSNTTIANRQFIEINDIISFVQRQNFRGEEYEERHAMQIEATKYWAATFMPTPTDFPTARQKVTQLTTQLVAKHK